MATVVVNFEANADDLLGALQGIDTAADRATSSMGGINAQAANTSQQLDGVKFAAQAAGGRVGEMAGRIENAGRALSSFASNPVALAIAGVTALGAGAAIAGASVVAAFVGVTRAAQDAADEIASLEGLGITGEQVAAIEEANAALDSISAVVQGLVVQLGAELAPTVTEVATVVTALGLMMQDAFSTAAESTNLVREGFVRLIEGAVNPLNVQLIRLVEGFAALARAAGRPSESLEALAETLRSVRVGNILLDNASRATGAALGNYGERARALIADLQALKTATGEVEIVFGQTADDIEFLGSVGESSVGNILALNDALLMAALGSQAFRDATAEAIEEVDRLARREQRVQDLTNSLDAVSKIGMVVSTVATGIGDAFEAFGAKSEKAARVAFAASKAAGIADAVVKTAQGIMNAFATLPTPVALGVAPFVAATGAAQIATIAATTFEGGGGGGAGGGIGASGLGALDDLTTGGAASTVPSVTKGFEEDVTGTRMTRGGMTYRHRDLDVVARDGRRYPGGAFDAGGGTGQNRYDS